MLSHSGRPDSIDIAIDITTEFYITPDKILNTFIIAISEIRLCPFYYPFAMFSISKNFLLIRLFINPFLQFKCFVDFF